MYPLINLFSYLLCQFAGDNYRQPAWGALDDVAMGRLSESIFQIDPSGGEKCGPTGVFKGLYQILTQVGVKFSSFVFEFLQ